VLLVACSILRLKISF